MSRARVRTKESGPRANRNPPRSVGAADAAAITVTHALWASLYRYRYSLSPRSADAAVDLSPPKLRADMHFVESVVSLPLALEVLVAVA